MTGYQYHLLIMHLLLTPTRPTVHMLLISPDHLLLTPTRPTVHMLLISPHHLLLNGALSLHSLVLVFLADPNASLEIREWKIE